MTAESFTRTHATLTNVVIFAGPGLLALVVAVVLPHPASGSPAGLVLAALLLVGVTVSVLALGPDPAPTMELAVPPLLYTLVVATLRHVEGGAESGLSFLLLVPVFWVALYGSRRYVLVVVAATAAALLVPILVVGAPLYPDGEWRRSLVWLVVSPLLGLSVQSLVRRARSANEELAAHEDLLLRVAQVVRELPRDPKRARREICKVARELAGADLAYLCELDEVGNLVTSERDGEPSASFTVALGGETTLVGTAYLTRRPQFSADPLNDPRVHRPLAAELQAKALLCCPVLRGHEPLGVLGVVWTRSGVTSGNRAQAAVDLLAGEAAAAIERADLLARLTDQSQTDPLTGLDNRRHWDLTISEALLRAGRHRRPLCVGLIDLDHFKRYNDAYGHQQGDQLLKEAAAAWRAQLRESDTLARWGGEEFAVLLPDCGVTTAAVVLERLRTSVPRGQHCSIGLASWDGEQEPNALMAAADAALYAAKQAGRNRLMTLG